MSDLSSSIQQFDSLQQAAYQIASCTDQLFRQIEHQQALSRVIDKVRSSLEIEPLLTTTVAEVRQLLNADRVEVFRFCSDEAVRQGRFVAEDIALELPSAFEFERYGQILSSLWDSPLHQGSVKTITDIHQEAMDSSDLEVLEMLQVRASLIVPVLIEPEVWGLLSICQCHRPRHWQLAEIEFAQKIATHFAIALQKAEYLEKYKSSLAAQAKAQAQVLASQKSLIKIITKIRQSLDFSEICQTATDEVHQLLEVDRAAIYRFNDDWSGSFLYETAGSQWVSLIEAQADHPLISKNVSECSVKLLDTFKTTDTHLAQTEGGAFAQGEIFRICPDIYSAGFSDCYIQVLESYQAHAYTVVAIYINQKLWGLLAAYQNSGPRLWNQTEVQLLVNIAEQLGVALKQAEYVRTIERQSAQLNQTLKELKQSQAQLIQREKMASLGQFVAGIAHEINNPVNFIYGNLTYVDEYVSELLSLVNPDYSSTPDLDHAHQPLEKKADAIDIDFIQEDLPKILKSMKVGAERIRNIVLSLRNFSRLDEADIKAVDIHEGIDSTLLILGHRLKTNGSRPTIAVIKDYGQVPPVECYPAQLNQVFMNLLSNAVDAIEEAFELSTAANPATQPAKIWITTALDGQGKVEIRIRDSGVGLQSQDAAKLFDYFYTTKPVGQGTGLGLAISRQIITEKHCGLIQVNPNLEQGAEFIIRLPSNLSQCLSR